MQHNQKQVCLDVDSLFLSNTSCSVNRTSRVITLLFFHTGEDQYLQNNSGSCNCRVLALLPAG